MSSEFEQLIEFSKSFDYSHDNDREIVIVGCAYIERLVKDIVKASFIDDPQESNLLLSDSSGALAGLVPRARLLYLLKVIPEIVFSDIKTVGKIRNEFAHNVTMSFSEQKVIDLCKNLKWHEHSLLTKPPAGATARDIYQVGVNQLVTHLGALPGLQRLKRGSGN